jgi:hypothetical protein
MRNVDAVIAAFESGAPPKLLLFWGHTAKRPDVIDKACFSQWWPCRFVVDGVAYASAEHFMMAEKARLFGDAASRDAILAARTPAEAKKRGRGVQGYDDDVWAKHRFDIVTRASVAKFEQNEALGVFLRQTGSTVLVEASPTDRIWGIGLAASDAAASDPRTWKGLNLLGFALMEARSLLARGA